MTPADEIEYLKERVRQLEQALAGQQEFPHRWGLSKTEAKILRVLYLKHVATKDYVMDVLYGAVPAPPGEQLVSVYACKLRQKLARFGITIETRRGVGYYMDEASKAKLRDLLSDAGIAA